MEGRIVLHVDFDYFYAQCEEVRRPELKAKPVVVCVYSERGGQSGAVATANYTARKLKIGSGMPIRTAMARGSKAGAVFIPVDFDYYMAVSQKAMKVMRRFADIFEYVGRDEAYLDVTERTANNYETAARLAQQLKNAVRGETGITCSVGLTPNKLLSKIASDYKKPDGLTIVKPEMLDAFLEKLEIRDVPGIGAKTGHTLAQEGLKTIAQLRELDVFSLQQKFGRKTGTYIYNAARGKSDEPVAEKEPNVQYSKIITLKKDSKDPQFLEQSLRDVCARLYQITSERGVKFRSVGVQFVQSDLSHRSKSGTLRSPASDLKELEKCALRLLAEALEDQEKPVRRIGVRVSELSGTGGQSTMDDYFG